MKKTIPAVSVCFFILLAAFNVKGQVPCNANTFYGIKGDTIEELSIIGSSVVSNGTLVSNFPGIALAYCNNLNGGAFSPTFYGYPSLTRLINYNGTGWDTVYSLASVSYVFLGCGGSGNYLYFITSDSLVKYSGGSYSAFAYINHTTCADVAVDDAGNAWVLTGIGANTQFVKVFSPNGTLIKQYNCLVNTNGAYGCFLLNSVLYVGLGSSNPNHPNTILPISFTVDSAIIGTALSMPGTYTLDLACCFSGAPLAVMNQHPHFDFHVFPNPASDKVTITSSETGNEYEVYNAAGEKVLEGLHSAAGNFDIDIRRLTAGVYFIECRNSKGVNSAKFVKL